MSRVPSKTDVVVIGGGPAGAMSSAMLSKQGIDVVVLEKCDFPRNVVGESLIPQFWKYADAIDVSKDIEDAGFIRKSGGVVHWDGKLRTLSFKDYGYSRPGLHVERDDFDKLLLDKSKTHGASVYEGVLAKEVAIGSDCTKVSYYDEKNDIKGEISAKYLIDASGQRALTAKQFGFREFDPNFKFQAFYSYFDKSDYLNTDGKVTAFSERYIDYPKTFVSSTGHWGWIWHIVMREKVSVGILVPSEKSAEFKARGSSLEERFLDVIKKQPIISNLLNGSELVSPVFSIRDYAYLPHKLAFDNCFVTGDSAAFADPIISGGVTMAMHAGSLAAWAIENSLNNPARIEFYREVYSNKLNTRLQFMQGLSYPSDNLPTHLLDMIKKGIKLQSLNENLLTLGHLTMTNRAQDFPDLMDSLGFRVEEVCKEVSVPEFQSSAL